MRPRFARTLATCGFATALLALLGCGGGGGGSKDSVSGKITHNGQSVAGTVTFVGADKQEHNGPIMDGKYTVGNLPKGEYQVLVKGITPGGTPLVPVKGEKAAEGAGAASGAAPPEKYSKPGNGLTFTSAGGEQKHDIDLK